MASSTCIARFLSSDDLPAWIAGAAGCPWRNFFSGEAWLRAFPEEWDGPLKLVGVYRQDCLIAGATFTERRIAGKRVWGMHPMAPYSGFWIAEPEGAAASRLESTQGEVAEALDRFLGERVADALLRVDPWTPNIRAFTEIGWEAGPLHTYVTQIRSGEGEEAHFDNDARRQIAKARTAGISIRDDDDWTQFHRMANEMMKRKDLDHSYPFSLFKQLSVFIRAGDCGRLFTAFDTGGKALASAAIVWANGRATYLFGASAPEARGTGAPSLLQAEALHWLRDNSDVALYDWQGANAPAAARFKKNFNPTLRDYFEIRRTYSLPLAVARAGRDVWRRWKRRPEEA